MKPQENWAPTGDEVREALRRILVSPAFSHAPQLGAFLRFVVESALAGESSYIKSYTIAVAALGRNESFDPKIDPIVRVEAGRVRRALSRYYADSKGVSHAVVIELPLGSYVPVFRRPKRSSRAVALLARVHGRLGGRGRLSLEIGLVAIILAVAILLSMTRSPWGDAGDRPEIARTVNSPPARALPDVATDSILPIVIIQPFEAIRASPQQAAELDALRSRLRGALARFDEIEVADNGALQPGQIAARSTYRLAGLAEFRDNGDLILSLWLTDADEGMIPWTQTFEISAADARSTANRIVQQVVTNLAQPYGVIYARELADARVDPRYRCLMGAFEYRRGFKRTAAEGVDACLEQVTAQNPAFADGFALQSLRALHQYYDWQDGAPFLENAMMLAQKAVDLKPQSARARQALMNVLFARREIAAAFNEGEAAIALNPNDTIVLHAYGLLLLIGGQPEKGAALVRQAAALTPVRPAGFEFSMFLSDYLLGDGQTATDAARLFTNNDYQLLLVARAVSAARAGDVEQSRRAVERLVTLHPAWRAHARQRLERYFPSTELVDRLMGDLAAAGFVATQ